MCFSPVFARGLGLCGDTFYPGPPAFRGTILTFIMHNRIIPLYFCGTAANTSASFFQVRIEFTKNN